MKLAGVVGDPRPSYVRGSLPSELILGWSGVSQGLDQAAEASATFPSAPSEGFSDRTAVVEQCMCAVQWGCKGCLLLLYWRLTQNLTQHLIVKGAAIYVGGSYIIMLILYFAVWCRPFSDYWETPTSNTQCTTALDHLITNLVFNLTSDILIMSIPLPLFVRAHLELKRKLLLIFPFSLGFFTVVCAILSKHLSFTNPYSAEWVYWYCREASTAMIVTNMPYSWALIRRIFKLKSFFGGPSQERMQGGQVEEVQGHSLGSINLANQDRLREQSQATGPAGTENRKRSWPWHKSSLKKDLSTNTEAPIAGEGRKQTCSKDVEKMANITASTASASESSAGSVRRPTAGTADSAAVDKLYRLDLEEDDDQQLERAEMAQRGYDG